MQNATPLSGKALLLYALALTVSSMALCGASPQDEPARSPLVGAERVHVVARGESWGTIGARAGVTPAVLAARNGRALKSPLRAGDVIVIDNRHVVPDGPLAGTSEIVVNVPQRLLFYFADGRLQSQYPIAAGRRDWQTPLGEFTVILKEEEPTWDVPLSIQDEMRRAGRTVMKSVPPGPTNPLGRYWLGLSLDAVGIHGTIAPLSIYSFATHGCIRLHPEDIEALFVQVPDGERGRIVYETVLVAYDGTDVYLEVHPDPYNREPDRLRRALDLLDQKRLSPLSDLAEVAEVVRRAEGLAVPVTLLTDGASDGGGLR
jgi:L,D-transpeptidase ErfK/SrfK